MNNSLPYLQTERHFRLYERYLRELTERWPQLSVFTPQPPVASTETLSTRIRIAIKSLRNNQWPIAWNMVKFIQICDEVVVSTNAQPGKVVCGPYDLVRKLTPPNKVMRAQDVDHDIEDLAKINLVNPSEELIHAVVVLHHHQLLLQPSTIQTTFDIKSLEQKYDISVTKDGDTYTIL